MAKIETVCCMTTWLLVNLLLVSMAYETTLGADQGGAMVQTAAPALKIVPRS